MHQIAKYQLVNVVRQALNENARDCVWGVTLRLDFRNMHHPHADPRLVSVSV